MTKEISGLMRALKKKSEISRSAAQHDLSRFVISSGNMEELQWASPGSSAGIGSWTCLIYTVESGLTLVGGAGGLSSRCRQPLDVWEFRKAAWKHHGPRGPLQLAPRTITSQQLLRPNCTNRSWMNTQKASTVSRDCSLNTDVSSLDHRERRK